MTLHRTTLRTAARAALAGWLPPGTTILVGQQWPMEMAQLPAVLLDFRREGKSLTSRAGGEPRFAVTCPMVVRARAMIEVPALSTEGGFGANHGDLAEAVLDLWIERIQDAVLCDPDFVRLVDAIPSVSVETQVVSEEQFIAEAGVTFDLVWSEVYPPRIQDGFAVASIRVDAIDPFDPGGTYPATPGFPAPAPAPRTSGPDGRAEAALTITLPTP